MGDLKALIKAKLLRRNSAAPSVASSKNSLKSGRPRSRSTSRYAASSINEAGDEADNNKENVRPDEGHGRKSPRQATANHAVKIRPSTRASAESASASSGSRAAASAGLRGKDDPYTDADTERLASISRSPTRFSQASPADDPAASGAGVAVAVDGAPDGPPAAAEVGGGGGSDGVAGDETLAGSNSDSQHRNSSSTTSSTTSAAGASLASGNDLHPSGLANANPSTVPAINAALPSINENPTTSNPIASPDLSSAEPAAPDLAPAQSCTAPATPLDAAAPAPPAPSSASLVLRPSHTTHDEALGDSASLLATPISPTLVPAHLRSSPNALRPSISRRQSILPNQQRTLITTLLNSAHPHELNDPEQFVPISGNMVTRKIWVKRPGASATMITINEEDLVDDVRDMILRKYTNSLGRQFDAPDLTLRIVPKDQNSRQLQPDEPMGRTLDAYFPGGQTVDDALLIDVPNRRTTPKASPNPRFYDDHRPHESGTDYFPPYPPAPHTHHGNLVAAAPASLQFPPSMAILGNGQLPPLPSPGSTRRLGPSRPKIGRMHTASPASTVTTHAQHAPVPAPISIGTHVYSTRPQRSRTHSAASSDQSNHPQHTQHSQLSQLSQHSHPPPSAPPIPTPPAPERVATPPPRVASPRPTARPKKKRTVETPTLPPGMLNGSVPPINVLIVEDNIINLKLLEAFVKRLKVRWQTAMNGRDAVNKWRTGGFHLVLMDIQLPIMNGLEATREIRRIEKVNSIGVFSSSANSAPDEVQGEPDEQDKLPNTEMFKSPVIIVALTASSLQSDRHEALAAGCNDFLTKPVNFVWLERKVMEWGCMQALIDFDGWRKWKDYSQKAGEEDAAKKAAAAKAKAKKNRLSMTTAAAAA
ncbi:hypothetical protein JX266_002829 [Neoarthrinium moseri]|nr:hypothetical protein JX266_002829 [Neoarthrinium moseri]